MHPHPITSPRGSAGGDTTRPNLAAVYDCSLGGKDNVEADREAFETIRQAVPRVGAISRMNRRWLHRVVRYLAGFADIDQFLDIGAGLPTVVDTRGLPAVGNTHQIAQLENAEATVVYVDNDPMCCAHGRVLLERNENTHYVQADILDVGTVLENREVTRHLDVKRPIAVLLCGLLHHLDDRIDPAGVMREYNTQLPGGSYVAITNFWDPGCEDPKLHGLAMQLQEAFVEGVGSGWYRTRDQLLEYFEGLDLVPPGLAELEDWFPYGPPVRQRLLEERVMLGGVGHKKMPPPPRLRTL